MKQILFALLLITACSETQSSTRTLALRAAGKDCRDVRQVCVETFPPQCFDVCADATSGTNPDCSVSFDGKQETYTCGSDTCIAASVYPDFAVNAGASGGSATIACPADAKRCPDGSYVARTGVNCEFAACGTPPIGGPDPVACTEEAKRCPDGSYVARTGPKCEFAACGTPQIGGPDPVACTRDAKLCKDGSSVGRVGPYCEFEACPGESAKPVLPVLPDTKVIICAPTSGDNACAVAFDTSTQRESFVCPGSPPLN